MTDANGQSYVYDGENKQVKASNGGGTLGEYFYDGDGKRVTKVVPSTGEVTIFVYDAAGKQIAEYSTVVESVEDAKVAYLTADHLGSPRIHTDRDGKVTARHDYHPYGEEIITSQRTSHAEYTLDSVRKQFTGYERDGETGLDFAQTRFYHSSTGRFTSPDDFARDTDTADPQSLNKYGYVRNNPLAFIDPTGEKAEITVTYDEKNKKYLITVSASFGVYVESGKLSQNEINKQVALLKEQISRAYNDHFSNGNFKFDLKTNITVKQFKSESDAKGEGDKGKIDNIVGLVQGQTAVAGRRVNGQAFRYEGENFDRMRVATEKTAANFTYAHEFGHLLNGGHQDEVHGLMNTVSSQFGRLKPQDFNKIFPQYLDAVNRSKAIVASPNQGVKKFWTETARAAHVRPRR
ncbi:MAG: RHS repeat-associated core domain-containing protein [Chloracidobacterium sp.]|nr:RHS repeat-associated core domain-containing protein [Chloracidobacterium sp.]